MPKYSIEDLLAKLEYITVDQLDNPRWELEDMVKIHPSLDEDNYLTYVIYLLMKEHELPEEQKEELKKMIEVMKEIEKKQIEKLYGNFEEVTY